ncbi:MAG: NAD(P)-binding protein [Actinomycetota bacterium]|nr:NAD(P)-binding protein [Actinomycetota bacterium]
MSNPLCVIIIGGGIGGLCLAQGLRKAGVAVQVYEHDRAPGDRPQGYRIHVNPAGARSSQACLPDRLWEAFLATSGPGGAFGFLTEQLDELVVIEESIMYPGGSADPAQDHYAVDRRTLRRLLLAGLDDEVHFDAEFIVGSVTSCTSPTKPSLGARTPANRHELRHGRRTTVPVHLGLQAVGGGSGRPACRRRHGVRRH